MTALTLNLMFRNNAEEAVKFSIAVFSPVFGNCRILKTTRNGGKEPASLRDFSGNDRRDHAGAGGRHEDHQVPAVAAWGSLLRTAGTFSGNSPGALTCT